MAAGVRLWLVASCAAWRGEAVVYGWGLNWQTRTAGDSGWGSRGSAGVVFERGSMRTLREEGERGAGLDLLCW